MTNTALVGTAGRDSHDEGAVAAPIPTPVFAPSRLERGGCKICGEGPVLRVGGPRPAVALCERHAAVAWQQLTEAITSDVIVQPEATTQKQQPTSESELRRALRGRRVYVAVPMGNTTALVPMTVNEASRLWCLAGVVNSPRQVHLDDDDLELIDLAVLNFSGTPTAGAE